MAVPPTGAEIIFEAILKTFAGVTYESVPASLGLKKYPLTPPTPATSKKS